MTPSMDNSERTASARGHIRNTPYSSGTQQVPHLSSHVDHGSHQQQGTPCVDPSSRHYTALPGDRNCATAQENIYQRPSFGTPFYTTPHMSGGNPMDHVSHPTSQRAPLHTVPQWMPPCSPYSQAPPMMSGPFAYDVHGRRDMETSHGHPGQQDSQAVQGLPGNPTVGFTHSFRFSLPPPYHGGGVIGAPVPQQSVRNWSCLAPGCLSSFDRLQERKRHLLTHLPHWIHCPYPGCCWRGNRPSVFRGHWGNCHPPSGQDLDEGQFKAYDPGPLVEGIEEGSLSVEEASNRAVTMVKERASELGKQELWEDPWGRKGRRAQLLG